ncbi:MAG: hypothetical protein H7301_06830 [Cryobacterium sp.]|nr:hypothetical protein [Oligoflexia bacterium]
MISFNGDRTVTLPKNSAFLISAIFFGMASSAFAGSFAEVHLSAQLWKKNSTSSGDAHYFPIGRKVPLDLSIELSRSPRVLVSKRSFSFGELSVLLSFYRVAETNGVIYVTTQTRLEHRTAGLIAECSRFDPPDSRDIGVGSCSGAFEGRQFGISFSKKPEQ